MGVKRKKRQMNLTLEDVKRLKVQKLVIYDRISSEMQKQFGKGIETQEFEIMKWIEFNLPNAEIVEVITDKAQSAYSIPLRYRENGKRLFNNVPNWKNYNDGKKIIPNSLIFNIIVVFEGSRLFRDSDESTPSYSFFEQNDIFVISVSDNKLNTFIGGSDKTLRKVKEVLDESESDTKSARAIASKNYNRSIGNFTGGQLPYGFTWNKNEKKIEEISEQINVYKEIFNKYLYEDKGTVVIARELNEKKIPFIDNKRNKESKWTSQNVRDLLTNPILTGRVQYKKYVEEFDVEKGRIVKKKRDILDEEFIKEHKDLKEHMPYEKWREVIKKLASRNNRNVKKSFSPRTYLLTSYVKCPHCFEIMRGQNKGGKDKAGNPRIYYMCKNDLCKGYPKSFPKDMLEKEVISQIKDYLSFDEDDIEEIKKEAKNIFLKEGNNNIQYKNLQLEITKLENAIRRLEEQFKESLTNDNSDMVLSEYTNLKDQFTKMLIEKQQELSSLKSEVKSKEQILENVENALKAIESLYNICDNYSSENQPLYRKIVQLLVKEVVKKDGEMVAIFNEELEDGARLIFREAFDNEIYMGFEEISATSEFGGTHARPLHEFIMYTPEELQTLLIIISKAKNYNKI